MTKFSQYPLYVKNSGIPGSVDLSESSLSLLQDGNISSAGVPVGAGQKISVVASLQNRLDIDEVRYYYNNVGQVTIESSQDNSIWLSNNTTNFSGFVSASGVSSLLSSKYVRITHQVTTGSGNGYEVVVVNKDTSHGYWFDGSLDRLGVDANEEAEISEAQVYNKSGLPRNFYALLDSISGPDLGNSVGVSTTSGGPFVFKRQSGIALPRDFSFSSGAVSGTLVSGSYLVLDLPTLYGTFHSPVFDLAGRGRPPELC